MMKALATGEYEDHARSDIVVSVDSRPPWVQCATNPGIGWTSFSTSMLSDIPSYVELWESRIREYEKLVYQTEKIQIKVPDCCKVFIVRSLVPRDLEKDLLKVHTTANYKATKECILEQASIKRDAHFDDKRKHDKPVPMEVDALLAKVSALKDARGVGDEAGGTESHGHDHWEGGSHRQEEEAWTDHTSNTLD